MTNLAIPTLLVGIVMIAGIFALMPVEQASTVHTTIATNINDQNRAYNFAVNITGGNGIVLVPAETGVTLSGNYVLSSLPSALNLECGLTDGGSQFLGTNSTEILPIAETLANLGSGEGINLQAVTEANGGGVCQVTIVLDSAGG